MIQFSENYEVESRKVEFGISDDIYDITAEELAPEPTNITLNLDLKSSHVMVREGLPF